MAATTNTTRIQHERTPSITKRLELTSAFEFRFVSLSTVRCPPSISRLAQPKGPLRQQLPRAAQPLVSHLSATVVVVRDWNVSFLPTSTRPCSVHLAGCLCERPTLLSHCVTVMSSTMQQQPEQTANSNAPTSSSSSSSSSSSESSMSKLAGKLTGRADGANDDQTTSQQSESLWERIRPASEAQHEKRTH